MFKRFPIAPLALAIFPILSLLANNYAELSLRVAIRPLLISLAGCILLVLFLRLVLKNWGQAYLIAAFVILLFFTYGHIYNLLEQHPIGSFIIGRHRYLMAVYALVLLVGLWLLIFRLKQATGALKVINIISLALLIVPIAQLSMDIFRSSLKENQAAQAATALDAPLKPAIQPLPDVYYIVLDSHTRSDALLRDYALDNSPYLDQLRKMGFFVADCSRSNYGYTLASMVAAVDMDYLSALGPYLKQLNTNDTWVLLKQSRVRQLLENAGYKTVAFDTGYEWSRLEDADIYLSLGSDSYSMQQVNPFESMLIKSTALLILADSQNQALRSQFQEVNFPYSYHVNSQNFILEQLPLIAKDPVPTFSFVHLLVPHVPFVFKPDGSVVDDPLYYDGKLSWPRDDEHIQMGYTNQIQFIDRKMVEVMQAILENSRTPPIIVIHGDHGLLGENRYEILNAYYLPGNGSEQLYSTITPVNSFRLIVDSYFGGNYPLLPDISYDETGQEMLEMSPACTGN